MYWLMESKSNIFLSLFNVFSFGFVPLRMRIVDGEMQASAFFPFHGLAGYQIAYINHVAQFAYLTGSFHALKQAFGLFV